jgi:hypothetical protein
MRGNTGVNCGAPMRNIHRYQSAVESCLHLVVRGRVARISIRQAPDTSGNSRRILRGSEPKLRP